MRHLTRTPMKTVLRPTLLALSCVFLSACAVGPDFLRPSSAIPSHFKEAPAGWKIAEATPQDGGPWWEIFGDATLNRLVEEANQANQNILVAEANYRQAQAAVGSSRAGFFPNLSLNVSENRGKSAGTNGTIGSTRTTDRVGLASVWELDLWGRLRRLLEGSEANAEAAAGDLVAARLGVQSSLVQSYLQLRINDEQDRLLERTLIAYRRSLEITRNRYEAGVASQADVAQAETQLKSTEAQRIDLGIQRAQLEHALAALLGKTPAAFQLAKAEQLPQLPSVPAALPSSLLERRPDIAAAERRAAAANAQIGVAQAAFFPSITLNASGGYQNSSFANILSTPYRYWSLGPTLAQTLFDAGARSAQKEQALAAYDKSVATYRQTVLTAFQEVEDNLAALRILGVEKEVQQQATRSAREFLEVSNNQYLAGTVSYLNVATAQAALLSAERSSLDLLNRQLSATVGLIRALGGWDGRPAVKTASAEEKSETAKP